MNLTGHRAIALIMLSLLTGLSCAQDDEQGRRLAELQSLITGEKVGSAQLSANDPNLAETQSDTRAITDRTSWTDHSFYKAMNLQEILEFAKSDDRLKLFLDKVKASADKKLAAHPDIYRRVLNNIEEDGPIINNFVAQVPVIALAARYTHEQKYIDFLNRQMEEKATWTPLDRKGLEGGSWLFDAWGIRSIIEVLDIADSLLKPETKNQISSLLQFETDRIYDDYTNKRQWFFRPGGIWTPDRHTSNQYIIVVSGMIQAALYLGQNRNFDAYQAGVDALTRSLNDLGQDGSFFEGAGYSLMADVDLFTALIKMRDAGDRRLPTGQYVAHNSDWANQMIMPGNKLANFSDNGSYKIPLNYSPSPAYFLSSLLTHDHARLNWLIESVYADKWSYNLVSLKFLYETLKNSYGKAPAPSFAFFPESAVLTWRSAWDQNKAIGLWIKGGSVKES
ncbi:MAG: hypothetical protein NTX25_17565, partial [Proteobacteria bacterium]|nr:hypothetical protein [Pseudomonadota bacterium]